MTILFACVEGASLNVNGNCRTSDRVWLEIDLATIGDVSATLDPSIYAVTFISFFTLISSAYFAGMGLRTVLRFLR